MAAIRSVCCGGEATAGDDGVSAGLGDCEVWSAMVTGMIRVCVLVNYSTPLNWRWMRRMRGDL